jgi:hypothetical protein
MRKPGCVSCHFQPIALKLLSFQKEHMISHPFVFPKGQLAMDSSFLGFHLLLSKLSLSRKT